MEAGKPGIEIGATLRDARRRAGYDIREVEELTKIRIKYLRALENEEWELLPAPAYARGFLRTYAELLGLDGELLADEFHYRVEPTQSSYPHAEPVLSEERSRMRRDPPMRPGGLLIGLGAAIVVLLVILGILGGGDDEGDPEPERRRDARPGGQARQPDSRSQRSRGPVKLVIVARSDVEAVCVVDDRGKAVLNDSLLEGGVEERFDRSKRYLLDVGRGSLRLRIDGETTPIVTSEPASYRINSAGAREVTFSGDRCP